MKLIDLILISGGLLAALSVGAMCGLGLVVWLAGGRHQPPKKARLQAWPGGGTG